MTWTVERDETTRVSELVAAEAKAGALFDAVVERQLLLPGIGERAVRTLV